VQWAGWNPPALRQGQGTIWCQSRTGRLLGGESRRGSMGGWAGVWAGLEPTGQRHRPSLWASGFSLKEQGPGSPSPAHHPPSSGPSALFCSNAPAAHLLVLPLGYCTLPASLHPTCFSNLVASIPRSPLNASSCISQSNCTWSSSPLPWPNSALPLLLVFVWF
jgi:hypothetical protein